MPLNTEASEVVEEGKWRVPDLLAIKSNGGEWTEDQVAFLVRSISNKSLDDCQLGAMLMAIKLRGMTDRETVALTCNMRDSGSVFSWPKEWIVADKHSTGGVGDKVSLPLAPAVAALGLKVPMISGRGLGHTGGTLDKLESIPGFRVSLNVREMQEALDKVGCCIVGQTADIVPADRRMYAARDVTSTVKSTPLIVSSIVSKKAAESVGALVMDVKFGHGAFMKDRKEAEELAKKIVSVSKNMGISTTALLTNMNNPIGRTVGNALEVREALDCLRGQGPADLLELVTHLGGELLAGGGLAASVEDGRRAVDRALNDGSARATFCKMLQKQGVTEEVATSLCADQPDYTLLPTAAQVTKVPATDSGVVMNVDAMALAKVSLALGAGRQRVGQTINYGVGVVLLKVRGERVSQGEAWAELHHDDPLPKDLVSNIQDALTLYPPDEVFTKPTLIAARYS